MPSQLETYNCAISLGLKLASQDPVRACTRDVLPAQQQSRNRVIPPLNTSAKIRHRLASQ